MRTFSLIALLLLPTVAAAKAPSAAEIDSALLRLGPDDRAPVIAAEQALADAQAAVADATDAIADARLDEAACKQWQAAARAAQKAADKEAAWAQADGDAEAIQRARDLSDRSDRAIEWRDARLTAAQAKRAFHTAELTWAKAALKRQEAQLAVAQLEAYGKTDGGGSADVDLEMGKRHGAVGKAKQAEEKAAQKRDSAQAAWESAVQAAQRLAGS